MKSLPFGPIIILALTTGLGLCQNLPSTLPSKNGPYAPPTFRSAHDQRPTPTFPSKDGQLDVAGWPQVRPAGYAWTFHIGAKHYRARMTPDELVSEPDWKPSMPLPLNFAKVEEIARAELKKIVGDTASWEVTEFQLKRILFGDQPRWFYVIGMAPGEKGSLQKHDSFFAAMNLSGVVGKIEEDTAAR